MKRILIALLVITSLTLTAQESVLLRHNYTKGDSYITNQSLKQGMGLQGGMNMKITMGMIVTEVSENSINMESKITSVAMDMMQGGMSMSYDSNNKDEELDEMGQMLKSQFDPMMKATIFTSIDNLGNMIETRTEPTIPQMSQITRNSNYMNYPEEKVAVGSSWSTENDNQGMKMNTTYTVASIADGIVTLDVTGNVTGAGAGNIKGNSIIDIESGVVKSSVLEVSISAQGMNVTVTTNLTTTKM